MSKKKNDETIIAHLGEHRMDYHGAVVPPIFNNSLFTFESWDAIDAAFADRTHSYIYSRGNNPTVKIAEEKIAALAGGERAILFASGMAAISAAILHCVRSGDHIITIKNVYGPANNFISRYLKEKLNIESTFVQGESVEEIENAIRDNTRLIYLESPSSAVFGLQDIEAIAKLAKRYDLKTILDNTYATPIFQKPLSMGIDLELHSCSKYLGGHSDIVAGVVIGKAEMMESLFTREFELLGGRISPHDAWLLTRSLRTLPMRIRQHHRSALSIAAFLENHPKIAKVRYTGLPSFAQKSLADKQMTGHTGLMTFTIKSNDLEKIKMFFNGLEYFKIGVSWGGHESLIYAPPISYLREMTADQFAELGISLGDMRISVGLEHVDDLIADLKAGLEKI